jgi:hypothetical protein
VRLHEPDGYECRSAISVTGKPAPREDPGQPGDPVRVVPIGEVAVELAIYPWTLDVQRLRAAMGAKREYWPWNVTVTVSVGPLRCLARIRSASPLRGDSGSYSSSR